MEAAAPSLAPRRRPAGRRLRAASDERLLARMRAGDDGAFEVIYDRHHAALLAFCRHMLGNREEAEDALQQVFISAHRSLRADDRELLLKPWLYAVARNRCLSMLRARRPAVALDDVPEPSSDGLAVAAEVEQRQDLKALLGDLAGLPDDQRAALLLAELGDLSHDEIAQTLEVRRDKVKALVFQARESLMSSRQARDTDCREIQEQLATLRGGSLRRTGLRRHVAICPACAAFKAEVQRQKAAMAVLLPVLPSAALKTTVLGGMLGGGGGAGGAVSAGTAVTAGGVSAGTAATAGGVVAAGGTSLLGGGLLVKSLAVLAVAGTAGGGGVVALRQLERDRPAADRPATTAPGGAAIAAPGRSTGDPTKPAGGRQARETAPGKPGSDGRGSTRGRDAARNAASGQGHRSSATAPGQVNKASGPVAGRGNASRTPKAATSPPRPKATGGPTRPATGRSRGAPLRSSAGQPAPALKPRRRSAKDRKAGRPDAALAPIPADSVPVVTTG